METLDWSNIGFGYRKTDANVRCYYKDGAWGPVEVTQEDWRKDLFGRFAYSDKAQTEKANFEKRQGSS